MMTLKKSKVCAADTYQKISSVSAGTSAHWVASGRCPAGPTGRTEERLAVCTATVEDFRRRLRPCLRYVYIPQPLQLTLDIALWRGMQRNASTESRQCWFGSTKDSGGTRGIARESYKRRVRRCDVDAPGQSITCRVPHGRRIPVLPFARKSRAIEVAIRLCLSAAIV
jgi:hypothetical protein